MTRWSQLFRMLRHIFIIALCLLSGLSVNIMAKPTWFQKSSEHFTIIYRQAHAYLVPKIFTAAENSRVKLSSIFDYTPTQKITIVTFDFADYGTAGATTVPNNLIRLEIEPFELGYEHIPYHDRIQWLMDHELVHIFVNDQASKAETASRTLFSRVMPIQEQPLTVGFSLLTNFNRYSPRWHQEGIASFLETWLTGGFGRVLGNFDEMYFRAIVCEGREFAFPARLEARDVKESFLLGTLYYLYGTRFMAWLATNYGVESVIAWFRVEQHELYQRYDKKFHTIFGQSLDTAWQAFVNSEQQFQQENLARLAAAPQTPVRKISDKSFGWVSQPYLHASGSKILFGQHQPHKLTAITSLDLATGQIEELGSLPSPSIIQIASTAYDPSHGLFFYTTNNNQFYRDLYVLELASGKSKMLFENMRVGQLTVSQRTHELWGIRHHNGKASLVYSPHPYQKIFPVIEFDYGDELQHLAINPSGNQLAATLHQTSGSQSIIIADLIILKEQGRFIFQSITEDGSPEFPSWSPEGDVLYWNAYTNGVSNLYRVEMNVPPVSFETGNGQLNAKIEAMSHSLTGLFRPVYINEDSLFAFEFSSNGFRPMMLANRPAEHLPAIEYYGQKVVDRNPEIVGWSQSVKNEKAFAASPVEEEKTFGGLSGLKLHSFIPGISGFQNRQVYGVYAHLADPLNSQSLSIELGLSEDIKNIRAKNFHFRAAFDFRKRYRLGIEHHAASFYDQFNTRKASMPGTKFSLGHTHYWRYDNPHKITQSTDLSVFNGIKSFNDNLVAPSIKNFAMFETRIESKNIRRAIGSVDNEAGTEWTISLAAYGYDENQLQFDGGIHVEFGKFWTTGWPHNILHLKLAGGFRHSNDNFAISKFYLGGFGNRYLEESAVKQYREALRFPGLSIYSLASNRFAKIVFENNLPPFRVSGVRLGQHHLGHIDASVFAQGLLLDFSKAGRFVDFGGQINFVFEHWFNLESTLSAGIARAWDGAGTRSTEWFISFKLLRD